MKSPLKYHGGKSNLASSIRSTFPPHRVYVEPFAGGLSVLLAGDGEGVAEIVNDLSDDVSNFWRVLRDRGDELIRFLTLTPVSEAEYRVETGNEIALAARFFVRCRQSLGGRGESFHPISTSRTRRGMCEQVSAWLSAVDGLPEVHARLSRVAILRRDALKVIADHDTPETLFYLDPPYLASTRVSPSVYSCEMTEEQHRELLAVVRDTRGMVALSGYDSELYRNALHDWHRIEWAAVKHSGGRGGKATEILWTNYEPRTTDAD